MTLTVGSLFAGIGGIDLGLQRAGFEIRWQVEIDEFCRRVLEKHWPDVTRYGDITEVDFGTVEPVDLIAGGFPCQPVSVAGKRLAQDDERWLWPEFARAIRDVRPRYVLVENVPGLLVRGFGDVLGDLAALGYDAEWDGIPASAVGAPHIRNRLWILAYPQEFSERTGLCAGQSPEIGGRRLRDGGSSLVTDAKCMRLEGPEFTVMAGAQHRGSDACLGESNRWQATPRICRAGDGIPDVVDRLRGLGNAVVPAVAQWVGRQIVAFDAEVEVRG